MRSVEAALAAIQHISAKAARDVVFGQTMSGVREDLVSRIDFEQPAEHVQ